MVVFWHSLSDFRKHGKSEKLMYVARVVKLYRIQLFASLCSSRTRYL